MTSRSLATHAEPGRAARVGMRRLARVGAVAGLLAAACTTAVAAVADAAGTSLAVDGQAIPIAAFALWTLVGAAIGAVLARLLGERRRFVAVAGVATALSLVPAIALPDDGATRLVLAITHLVAAAVVVPALARALAGTPRH